jgi:hypothetical protein
MNPKGNKGMQNTNDAVVSNDVQPIAEPPYEPTPRDAIVITDLIWEALQERDDTILELLGRVNDLERALKSL